MDLDPLGWETDGAGDTGMRSVCKTLGGAEKGG